ncbi:restriction endonuclease subunit S [Priestia megaterium]
MSKRKKTIEELLEEALISEEERPYDVPDNWLSAKFNSVLKISSGKSLTKKQMNEKGNIPVFGGNGITGMHDQFNVNEETIVIGRVGFYCGSVHLTPKKAWITDNAFIVYFSESVLDKNYLYWTLKHLNLRQYSNSSAQPVISGKTLSHVTLNIPPLDEQKRIVNKVEHLLNKIEDAKQLIEEAKEPFELRRAAVLDKAFRGELTDKWRNDNGVKIEEWQVVDLEEVAAAVDPQPSHRTPPISDDGIPYIGVRECNYKTGEIDFLSARPVGETVLKEHIERYNVNEGDFIIGKIGTVGKPFNIPSERNYVLSANVILIQPKKESVLPRYLYYMFQSTNIENQLKAGINSTTQAAFGIKKARKLQVNLCSISEQKRIVEILDIIFAKEIEADKLSDTFSQLNNLKSSILSKAFRGELGTNDPSEESTIELLKAFLQEQVK